MRSLIAPLLAGLLASCTAVSEPAPTPTTSQPITTAPRPSLCGLRDKVVQALGVKYQEKVQSVGITRRGNLIEVMVSPQGKTWTILVTDPTGITCLVVAGAEWVNR